MMNLPSRIVMYSLYLNVLMVVLFSIVIVSFIHKQDQGLEKLNNVNARLNTLEATCE